MSWYRAGTIAVTNGSATVTGSGTAFIANVQIGEALIAPDGRPYEITNIASDTSLTINPAYLGSTASAQSYAIAPIRGRIAQLLSETSSLLASFAAVRDGIGTGLFPNGTAAAPAGRFSASQGTGFFRPAADVFAVATAGVERLRVGATGNISVGFTGAATGRIEVRSTGEGATAARFSSPAAFIELRPDDTNGNVIRWGGPTPAGGGVLRFLGIGDAERLRIDSAGNLRPGTDNTVTLGTAPFRWGTVFSGTGTINTSDEREKEWRGPLNEAELRAAKRIAAEIGIFQFLDAIADKGENARLHCGVRAQRTFAILEDEGLEWQRYAWCCYDEWEAEPEIPEERDEEGNVVRPMQPAKPAGNRYGIRTDQLALWLIAAQEQRLLALEAAL